MDLPKLNLFLLRPHTWKEPYCIHSVIYSLGALTDTWSFQRAVSFPVFIKIAAVFYRSLDSGDGNMSIW